MNSFYTRLWTGLIFVALIIAGIYISVWSFVILLFFLNTACLWEFFGLILKAEKARFSFLKIIGLLLGTGVMLIGLLSIMDQLQFDQIPFIAGLITIGAFSLFVVELYAGSSRPFENVAVIIVGWFYITVPLIFLIKIAFSTGGYLPDLVMALFILTWANDTFAYLVGSKIGKNKLFARISPGKTWEGTIGGGIFTLLFSLIMALWIPQLGFVPALAIGTTIVIFGTLGDLVESMLKRSTGVKDSGKLLPGHGGVLDRFDGFLFMLPFTGTVWLLLQMVF
jgi:phosphatidate cytidylyltransferase